MRSQTVLLVGLLLLAGCFSASQAPVDLADTYAVSSEEDFLVKMLFVEQEVLAASLLVVEGVDEEEALASLALRIGEDAQGAVTSLQRLVDVRAIPADARYAPLIADLSLFAGERREYEYVSGVLASREVSLGLARSALELELSSEVELLASMFIDVHSSEVELLEGLLRAYQ